MDEILKEEVSQDSDLVSAGGPQEEVTEIIEQDIVPTIIVPPAPSYDHLDQSAEAMDEERIRLATLFGNKKLLIKERATQLQGKWWEKLAEDLDSEDRFTRQFAMAEFNKIQIKLMPTKLANDDENPLTPTLNNNERERISKSIDEIVGFVRRQE